MSANWTPPPEGWIPARNLLWLSEEDLPGYVPPPPPTRTEMVVGAVLGTIAALLVVSTLAVVIGLPFLAIWVALPFWCWRLWDTAALLCVIALYAFMFASA